MKRLIAAVALCFPLFASAGQLSISCIGAESSNCPIAIDATLRQERLTAQFLVRNEGGGYTTSTLGFCGYEGSAGSLHRGEWIAGSRCNVSGVFRVVNGELTKQQLADGAIQFEIQTPMAFCGNSSGYAQCSLVVR